MYFSQCMKTENTAKLVVISIPVSHGLTSSVGQAPLSSSQLPRAALSRVPPVLSLCFSCRGHRSAESSLAEVPTVVAPPATFT